MIIPKGNIWQYYRSQALGTIVEGAKTSYDSPQTLLNWRNTGAYTVPTITAKDIVVEAYSEEIASALLGDIELLLDHAAEQHAQIYKTVSSEGWVSPAWLLVTVYYWCYFSMLAFSRLTGSAHIHLTDEQIKRFSALVTATPITGKPGAGAFRMTKRSWIGINQVEIVIEKLPDVIHKALWRDVIGVAASALTAHGNSKASLNEWRLFNCVSKGPFAQSREWPSSLRNAVNYRPGVGYHEVRKSGTLALVKYIQEHKFNVIEDVVSSFEDELKKLPSLKGGLDIHLEREINVFSRLLYMTALLFMALSYNLHEEIVEVRGLDKRWLQRRKRFYKKIDMIDGEAIWPFG